MDRTIQFTLNEKPVSLTLPESTPLLWALREDAGLTGTKYGCGKGLCGACTVHLDGSPIRSCITPVSYVEGKKVTTIEGVDETLQHPVQKAWEKNNVVQCGYCQPGQIMSALALLKANASPTDANINSYMSGNLCRCGTYPRIKQAILDAAEMINNGQ